MRSDPDVVAALRFSRIYIVATTLCYVNWLLDLSQHLREFPIGTLFSWWLSRCYSWGRNYKGESWRYTFTGPHFPQILVSLMRCPLFLFPSYHHLGCLFAFLLGGKRCSGPCWSRACWLSDFHTRKGRYLTNYVANVSFTQAGYAYSHLCAYVYITEKIWDMVQWHASNVMQST